MMKDQEIINNQLAFFKDKKAGCLFVAMAALNPEKYGWFNYVIQPEKDEIDLAIRNSIQMENASTITLIFPSIDSKIKLEKFITTLESCQNIILEEKKNIDNYHCLGFRIKINDALKSYVSGFGPFDFFSLTRRTPYTAITFRSKPRPNYDWVMKQAPEGIVHIADMNMQDLPENVFKQMWDRSIIQVTNINLPVIPVRPDERLSAKTSFVLPV